VRSAWDALAPRTCQKIKGYVSLCMFHHLLISFQESLRLQRGLKNLTPEAFAHAVDAIQADIEWRRVRAIAAALHVDAVQKHSKFLDVTATSEADTYVNAISEPLEAAYEVLASCTNDELNDRKNCSIATYELEETSFVAADTEFDHFENIACM
jgi:hypothetical protein